MAVGITGKGPSSFEHSISSNAIDHIYGEGVLDTLEMIS